MQHRNIKIFILLLVLWLILVWPAYVVGFFVIALFALAGLWALTVLLRGFFPWAYSSQQNPENINSGLVPPVLPDLPTPAKIDLMSLPQQVCRCGATMEPVYSLPGYYCWKCGAVVELDGGSSSWYNESNGHPLFNTRNGRINGGKNGNKRN